MKKIITQSIFSWELTGPQSATCELRFDGTLPLFQGHFPAQPIVPGVMEIEVLRVMAERMKEHPLSIAAVPKAKFLKLLLPDKKIFAAIRLNETASHIEVTGELRDESELAAQVVLHLKSAS